MKHRVIIKKKAQKGIRKMPINVQKKMGNVPRQIISNMERGKRTISLATAKKLAVILKVPASRFLDLKKTTIVTS